MELKIVKPKLTKEQAQYLQDIEHTKQQIFKRAKQLEYWGKNNPDIISADTANMLVAAGQKIADLIEMLDTGAGNEIKRIR